VDMAWDCANILHSGHLKIFSTECDSNKESLLDSVKPLLIFQSNLSD